MLRKKSKNEGNDDVIVGELSTIAFAGLALIPLIHGMLFVFTAKELFGHIGLQSIPIASGLVFTAIVLWLRRCRPFVGDLLAGLIVMGCGILPLYPSVFLMTMDHVSRLTFIGTSDSTSVIVLLQVYLLCIAYGILLLARNISKAKSRT
ncbi:MAG: hypothetical protein QM796_16065 [Chthoniobacteraceae bacterium]